MTFQVVQYDAARSCRQVVPTRPLAIIGTRIGRTAIKGYMCLLMLVRCRRTRERVDTRPRFCLAVDLMQILSNSEREANSSVGQSRTLHLCSVARIHR